jgi:hypothetical protein
VLYEAVRENLATLLAEASEVGRGLPRYVERDFARYLECGVLPRVPYRQWTLSFPHRVRWVLLKNVGLLSDVLTVFLRAVFALQRRRARRQGIRHGQVGAVSFIQFFGSALQVTPHFHSLVSDGVFVPLPNEAHAAGRYDAPAVFRLLTNETVGMEKVCESREIWRMDLP